MYVCIYIYIIYVCIYIYYICMYVCMYVCVYIYIYIYIYIFLGAPEFGRYNGMKILLDTCMDVACIMY